MLLIPWCPRQSVDSITNVSLVKPPLTTRHDTVSNYARIYIKACRKHSFFHASQIAHWWIRLLTCALAHASACLFGNILRQMSVAVEFLHHPTISLLPPSPPAGRDNNSLIYGMMASRRHNSRAFHIRRHWCDRSTRSVRRVGLRTTMVPLFMIGMCFFLFFVLFSFSLFPPRCCVVIALGIPFSWGSPQQIARLKWCSIASGGVHLAKGSHASAEFCSSGTRFLPHHGSRMGKICQLKIAFNI